MLTKLHELHQNKLLSREKMALVSIFQNVEKFFVGIIPFKWKSKHEDILSVAVPLLDITGLPGISLFVNRYGSM